MQNEKTFRTDKRTNERTDEQTDGQTNGVTWSLLELLIAAKNNQNTSTVKHEN